MLRAGGLRQEAAAVCPHEAPGRAGGSVQVLLYGGPFLPQHQLGREDRRGCSISGQMLTGAGSAPQFTRDNSRIRGRGLGREASD